MTSRNGKQTATLKDIAEVVGYSVNTVSRALRDKDDIALETRIRIKNLATELGYVNNAQASSLRLGYTKTIAVILGDISNPHFAILTKEIEERAGNLGYSTFLISTEEDDELECKAIRTALNKNVDGIILCPTQKSTVNVEFLAATGIPFVLIGRHFDQVDTNFVVCNDELGGYQATRHLLENGHRDILMINGPSYISSSKERYSGYCRALREYGIPVRNELVWESAVTCGQNHDLLKKVAEKGVKYSAIFAFSDLIAWEVWTYLMRAGRRVPEDCAIVGFDFIQSRMILPFNLTSISANKHRMSSAAIDLLLKQIKGETDEGRSQHIVVDTEIAEGDTVAKRAPTSTFLYKE